MNLQYSLALNDLIAANRFVLRRGLFRFYLPFGVMALISIFFIGYINFDSGANAGALVMDYIIANTVVMGVFLSLFYPRLITMAFSVLVVLWLIFALYANIMLPALLRVPLFVIGGFTGIVQFLIYRHFYNTKKGVYAQRMLSVDQDGVRETTEVTETYCRWSGITEIARDDKNLYLFVGRVNAFIVPRAVFANTEECERFYVELMRLKETFSADGEKGQLDEKSPPREI